MPRKHKKVKQPRAAAVAAAASVVKSAAESTAIIESAFEQWNFSADNYYGQRDANGLPHGQGVRLAPDGSIIGQQCGRWEHGVIKENRFQWVWRGFLPANAPLSKRASSADAIGYLTYYIGPTAGPLHLPNGAGKSFWNNDGLPCREGSYVDGLVEGPGSYRSEKGEDVYTGDFRSSLRHGIGKHTWSYGAVYEGEWKDDKMHGIGRYIYLSGEVYEGQWVNGERSGLGVLWDPNGSILDCGEWCDGEWVKKQPVHLRLLPADSKHVTAAMRAAGPSTLLLPSGGYYAGEGALFAADGTMLQRGFWFKEEFIPQAASAVASTTRVVDEVASTDCVICLDRTRDCLIDCEHFAMCYECAQSQQQCPICRVAITQRMQKRIVLS
jgi:hypothetical protein